MAEILYDSPIKHASAVAFITDFGTEPARLNVPRRWQSSVKSLAGVLVKLDAEAAAERTARLLPKHSRGGDCS